MNNNFMLWAFGLVLLTFVQCKSTEEVAHRNNDDPLTPSSHQPKIQDEGIMEALDLDAPTEEAFKALQKKYFQALVETRQQAQGDKEAFFAGMNKLRKAQQLEIKKLLSDEQYARYINEMNNRH